jgi:hypothetical protein
MVKSLHQGKENFVLESQLMSLFETKLPPAQKGGGWGLYIFSYLSWDMMNPSQKAEQLTTNNNHLFDKS